MQQKSFAVGLRIQHPQKMINLSQYGTERYNEILGAASYKHVSYTHLDVYKRQILTMWKIMWKTILTPIQENCC